MTDDPYQEAFDRWMDRNHEKLMWFLFGFSAGGLPHLLSLL